MLHESVYDGLRKVLGQSGVRAILFNIELTCYKDDLKGLHESLYSIFKDGAIPLEIVIAKEVYSRLGLPFDGADDFDFARCINQARYLFIAKQNDSDPNK